MSDNEYGKFYRPIGGGAKFIENDRDHIYVGPTGDKDVIVLVEGIVKVPARELIEAIAEQADLTVSFPDDSEPAVTAEPEEPRKPADDWFDVVPVSRAAKVTEEFVRNLPYSHMYPVRPVFDTRTGKPLGVEWGQDEVKQARIGDAVVVGPNREVHAFAWEFLDDAYREAT